MLSPERESLIREIAAGDFGLKSGGADGTMGMELLEEIDRLRADRDGFRNGQIQTQNLLNHALDDKLWIQARLAVAVKSMCNANSKILEGIPYGLEKGTIVDAARDILFEALSKIRGEK